jgi:hypothetical protein
MRHAAGPEPGGPNVPDLGNDSAMYGRGRILCAVPGCPVQGMQSWSKWLLGASATQFWGSEDRGVAAARKTSHARGVRMR